ncbi:glycosyltransferase [Paracoccus sp. (in: a-proteobacteria)]|uniref:glycosyltransferase n=1 Tax=Paracoccus sp. TaxID=267 RepID=UPI00396C9DA0
MPRSHVVILLASFQGAAHLATQLASIRVQTHADWSLIVSDDGSNDGTTQIVQDFAATLPIGRVSLIKGPQAGATMNFLWMLDHVPPDCLAAFCDQDDLWFPDKLERGVAALSPHAGPAHYAARTIITDSELRPLAPSRHFRRPLGLRNALVQAIMAGNTSVFNPGAVALLQRAAPDARRAGILSHDWWAYQVTSAFGAVLIHDPRPSLLYRQHPRSEVGRNDTVPALKARLSKLMAGDFGTWLAANRAALEPLAHLMPAAHQDVLDQLRQMQTCQTPQALKAMRRGGFYRQTAAGTAALWLAVASGSLRLP